MGIVISEARANLLIQIVALTTRAAVTDLSPPTNGTLLSEVHHWRVAAPMKHWCVKP